jgi:hypothetical protein
MAIKDLIPWNNKGREVGVVPTSIRFLHCIAR